MATIAIPIKGDIVDSDTADFYDWFGLVNYTSPGKVSEALEGIGPDDDVELHIGSNGGDVFAASEIYTALRSISNKVTAIVEGLAASAASVITMSADTIKMSPTSMMMIHKASSVSAGNSDDMNHESEVLQDIDNSIANAYETKTGMDAGQILTMMANETWMTAQQAVEAGFADEVLDFADDDGDDPTNQTKQPFQAIASTGFMVNKTVLSKWHALMAKAKLADTSNTPTPSQPEDSLTNQKLAILLGK